MKKGILIILILILILVIIGCQSNLQSKETPQNSQMPTATATASIAEAASETASPEKTEAPTPTPYDAPKTWQTTINVSNDFTVNINADIIVPDITEYPVVTTENTRITQEQADRITNVLIGDKTLYKYPISPDKYDIETYLKKAANANENLGSLRDIFYKEYAPVPENNLIEEGSRKFAFIENMQINPWYCKNARIDKNGDVVYTSNNKPVPVSKQSNLIWDLESAQKNQVEDIAGVVQTDSGRKELLIHNENANQMNPNSPSSYVRYNDYNPLTSEIFPEGTFDTQDVAVAKATNMVQEMGLNFFVSGARSGLKEQNGGHTYYITFQKDFKDAPSIPPINSNILLAALQRGNQWEKIADESAEEIFIAYSKGGMDFSWKNPSSIVSKIDNAKLLSWDAVQKNIIEQIKTQTFWEMVGYAENPPEKDVIRRRFDVDAIILSYIAVKDKNNIVYMPAWNVCGKLYYTNNEETAKELGFAEDFVRRCDLECEDPHYSYLTLSALDGSYMF